MHEHEYGPAGAGRGTGEGHGILGIVAFTRGLAREFGKRGITANCIGPGTIDVERDTFQKPKGLHPDQAVRRLGKPEAIASLMVYLASGGRHFR